MTLKDKFDFDLHNGETIQGMQRSNAYCLALNNDNSRTVVFDNGNQYTLDPEGNVIERIDGSNEQFIDRQIIKVIYAFIKSKPLLTFDYDFSHSNFDDCIEIYYTAKDKKKDRSCLIRIVLNRGSKRIDVPNIMVPFKLKYNGFGKGVLNEIFKIAKKHNYKLYLVQMVESFYNRMVNRGAVIIDPFDVVEITENTNLAPINSK